MKVARFHAPGDIRIEDAPEPVAGPGELKIRVRNCSTCGTDAKIFKFGHHHIVPPRVMGHEIAGEVVDTGARVQVIAAIPCGTCPDCVAGRRTVCPNQESMGYHYDGGFAEYMIVPAKVLAVDGVNAIPDGVGFAEASVAEPLACVLNGQELARVGARGRRGRDGRGPDRLPARAAGAGARGEPGVPRGRQRRAPGDGRRARPSRRGHRRRPRRAGAEADRRPRRRRGDHGGGLRRRAGAGRADGGQAGSDQLFGGLPKDDPIIALDSNLVHYRELTIVGANGSSPAHNAQALRLVAEGAVPVSDLITHRLPLPRVLDGIDLVSRGAAIKVTIEP
ncbi:hypothetical protein GCM10020220_107020 [Nonomuraea rubra]|uniref:alcohol dehydrogenase catalytic domain-containing protein n=1 Tax=Nonomuraea rubra TaxID=46180 RepID=UPI00336CA098